MTALDALLLQEGRRRGIHQLTVGVLGLGNDVLDPERTTPSSGRISRFRSCWPGPRRTAAADTSPRTGERSPVPALGLADIRGPNPHRERLHVREPGFKPHHNGFGKQNRSRHVRSSSLAITGSFLFAFRSFNSSSACSNPGTWFFLRPGALPAIPQTILEDLRLLPVRGLGGVTDWSSACGPRSGSRLRQQWPANFFPRRSRFFRSLRGSFGRNSAATSRSSFDPVHRSLVGFGTLALVLQLRPDFASRALRGRQESVPSVASFGKEGPRYKAMFFMGFSFLYRPESFRRESGLIKGLVAPLIPGPSFVSEARRASFSGRSRFSPSASQSDRGPHRRKR